MIRVTVTLVPHGDEKAAREIGRMEVWNDGTHPDDARGHYGVRRDELVTRGEAARHTQHGEVHDHDRAAGVWELVWRAIEATRRTPREEG